MKEFTYYSIWGTIDTDAKEIKILGNKIEYTENETIDYRNAQKYYVVSRFFLNHIVNSEWGMKKSANFIES